MARIINTAVLLAALAFGLSGCGQRERARIEIDFSKASEWRYLLAVDISGTPQDSAKYFSGSLRAYLQGQPGQPGAGPLQANLADVHLIAPFMAEDERSDVERRLNNLRVMVSEDGVTLSDTAGIPGVFSGAWDIMRSPARVIPAMPNADMAVGSSWEREQRFPLTIPQGEADGLLYQLYTLDSLFKTPEGFPVAAISWVFTYRVAMLEDGSGSLRKHPLSGSGRGTAKLDLNRKKLLQSQAAFQVTHSNMTGLDINEVVHFEMVE
ncbi:MAG: hypothetical protein FWB85_07640 [Chitinispirillia bacterium]|nr:hypothetical protein [Chitinispirillia bacterium]MCL2242144.1 hypothetical protein [Chitinispirillia bacterium]